MDALQNRFDCETSRRNDARGERERERDRNGDDDADGRRGEEGKGVFEERRLGSLKGKKKSFEAYNNNLYAGHISRKAAVNYGSRGRRK